MHTTLKTLAGLAGAGWILLPVACAAPAASASNLAEPQERPRLVVMVVVDQLRADLLDRYDDLFTGGFRRLRDGGFRFTQAAHDHANTETAPGHATLSTGVVPARHGIVSNDWYITRDGGWRAFYNAADSTAPIVDVPNAAGRSPANLMRGGIADWFEQADPAAQVVSISHKDRASIPMAGRSHGDVYWILPSARRFVTSSYYRSDYPEWVVRFNADSMPRILGDSVWELEVPPEAVARARRDAYAYEADGVHTTFPHRYPESARQRFSTWVVDHTPYPDVAVLGLARAAIRSLDLGGDAHTDFLAVSFSQADYLGHKYGPLSLEQLDNLLRLDKLLGELFVFFDANVGAGRWVLGLSADHGVMDTPEYRVEQGLPGRRLRSADIARLDSAVAGLDPLAPDYQDRLARTLETVPFIGDVVTRAELESRNPPADSFLRLFRNSSFDGRPSGLLFRLGMDLRWTEGTIQRSEVGGSTHGSPYWYDRHVPLIFYGADITTGASDEAVRTVDLAPTLAALGSVRSPDDLDGRSLLPSIRRSR
jgi:predicted AlkP superfamily pyrophosphatase or phosphodiesterase